MEIFEEMIVDPWKTIKRDTLPRFFTTDLYITCKGTQEKIQNLPSGSTFTLRPPRSSSVLLLDGTDLNLSKLRAPLNDLIHDYILYSAFLEYLQSIHASESLILLRSLSVYHCYHETQPRIRGVPEGVFDAAVKIYIYFIAEGSAFETSVSHSQRFNILNHLVRPTIDMFEEVEKSTKDSLNHHLLEFYTSSKHNYFSALPDKVKMERKAAGLEKGCFPLCKRVPTIVGNDNCALSVEG